MDQATTPDVVVLPSPLADELRRISIFSDLPDEDLAWLASQMTVAEVAPGEVFLREGVPADRLFAILEGEMRGTRETDGTDNRVFVAQAGQVTGMLPFSRLTHFPLTTRAVTRARIASLPKDRFPEMLKRMPVLAQRLVGILSDRIRENTKNELQQEKMAALGKLSAGLAHELNNPASAARRAAESLGEAIGSLREANTRLDRRVLTPEQRLLLSRLEGEIVEQEAPVLDPLDRGDREDEIAAWLEKRSVAHAAQVASSLVEAGFEYACLEDIASHFPTDVIEDVLTRVSASLLVGRLAKEIEHSTTRISDLVRAIKEYSHMDQMPEQEVDVHQGLENTLLILRHRLKQGISITREFDRNIPKVCAHPGELNQVWTNLIDNAIDAMNGKGELRVRTAREVDRVLVEIGDNGPGIPPDVQQRIFEPFFSTKGVGQGLGLGLESVYRIVRNHQGDIRFQSRPGDTRFQVRLPIAGANGRNRIESPTSS
jgi:signal transduction histidine kinase